MLHQVGRKGGGAAEVTAHRAVVDARATADAEATSWRSIREMRAIAISLLTSVTGAGGFAKCPPVPVPHETSRPLPPGNGAEEERHAGCRQVVGYRRRDSLPPLAFGVGAPCARPQGDVLWQR